MTKHFKKFIVILCAAICLFAAIGLVGCDSAIGEYAPLMPLTEEETAALKTACTETFSAQTDEEHPIREVVYFGYYGRYHGLAVCKMAVRYVGWYEEYMVQKLTLDGIYIGDENDTSTHFYVYNSEAELKERFVLLGTAYENGAISKADLQQIAYYAQQK